MCGIVGCVSGNDASIGILIEGLKKLEYRGYDSSGVAYIHGGKITIKKEDGRLSNLEKVVDLNYKINLGIGHTRWATHGVANKINAHPHNIGKFTVVHNGIIENYMVIKNMLEKEGYSFKSDTDTEVISALLDYLYKIDKNVLNCIRKLNDLLEGSYALGIICSDNYDELFVLKNKSPLIIGVGDNENYIASDVPAILDKTNKYISLKDGCYASIKYSSVEIYDDGNLIDNDIQKFDYDISSIYKNGYEHFMLKEINEQPMVFKRLYNNYLENGIESLLKKMPDFSIYNSIRIVACGSAMHAGLIGKQMLEKYADIETSVDISSEFRYCKQFLKEDELVILISQSGETADTLEALKISKENGNDTLGIINEKGSTIAREAKFVLYTEAGKEIAVATTKAYSAQVMMLSLIALDIGLKKNIIDKKEVDDILNDCKKIPNYMQKLLESEGAYEKIASKIKDNNDIFFIGRKVDYALAEEGSLKLKEISYTHSEAYAAGELKHGTISLIEKGTPVFAIVTDDDIANKTINNIKEVKARGAYVICVTNKDDENSDDFYDYIINIPKVNPLFSSLLTVIPLQMVSYYLAKLKLCDIDKPRNLAKSVTVE